MNPSSARFFRHRSWAIFGLGLTTLALVACGPSDSGKDGADGRVTLSTEEHNALIDRWQAAIAREFPATRYSHNTTIPPVGTALADLPPAETAFLRIGLPWVFNDEAAPWILARDRGYFAEAGLRVDLIPGGPGKDHLLTLAGGVVDLAIVNDASRFIKALGSTTPIDAVIVSTVLQHSPGMLLTLDDAIGRDEISTRSYTPDDLRGKTIGVTAESEYHVLGVLDKAGIPRDAVRLRRAGNEPNILAAGGIDYMSAWLVNQPRMLEIAGFRNWGGMRYDDILYREFSDITVVMNPWAARNEGTLQRYHWALRKAVENMLTDPVTTAAETAAALDGLLTAEQVLWRFNKQAPLIQPTPETPLLVTDPAVLDRVAAYLAYYKVIRLALDPE